MLVLEALRAKFGDSLILHSGTAKSPQVTVIDGGPPGVYNDALRPRLEAIRAERGLDARTPLDVELMMVSHIDDDHVAGLLELARKLNQRRESGQPLPWKIRRFWHNSFDDILDNDDLQVAGGGSALNAASLGDFLAPEGSAILASVKQGRELAKLLDALTLGGNPPFKGLVLTDGKARAMTVGDLKERLFADVFDRNDLGVERSQVAFEQAGEPVAEEAPLLEIDERTFTVIFAADAPLSLADAVEILRHRIRTRFKPDAAAGRPARSPKAG